MDVSENNKTSRQEEGVCLYQVYPPFEDKTKTDIDIIAIHGLDTRSPETWEWRASNPNKTINWLVHPKMLPEKAKGARIFYCNWPADLLQKSVSIPTTLEESARSLLRGIRQHLATNSQAGRNPPILFIASCLGGIILIKALDIDKSYDRDKRNIAPLRRATRGIIFLATPFRGTAFKDMPNIVLKAWALVQDQTMTALIQYAKGDTSNLDDLVGKFIRLKVEEDYHVFMFWEAHKTSLLRKFYLAWLFSRWLLLAWLAALVSSWLLGLFSPWILVFLSLWLSGFSTYQPKQVRGRGTCRFDILLINYSRREHIANVYQLVDENSAKLQGFDGQRLERVHVLMNKFSDPTCKDWEKVAGKIEEIVRRIRQGTPDAVIRDKHYTTERLRIERLSGDHLPMDQCYINLAIVEVPHKTANGSERMIEEGHMATPSSPFSLFARLKVETPNMDIQVTLPSLFNPRKGPGGNMVKPRRILIRGSAGVGKTTLCKKIVHEFCGGTWSELFDRVLWVPLRNLKDWSSELYNLEKLFSREYFPERVVLAQELNRIIDVTNGGRTLFILDGLDEVSQDLARNDHKSDFLRRLLDHPNAIVTSRPHISLPAGVRSADLEVETVGFYPDQVKEYIQNTFTDPETSDEIQSYLQQHHLIHVLVRIPIQLDALCYTWNRFGDKPVPHTMTAVYKSIEESLWKKDILRLEKQHEGTLVSWPDIADEELDNVENFVNAEIYLLEVLAFTGLFNDVIDFKSEHRKAISKLFKLPGTNILLDRTLPRLSFLRTSDLSSKVGNRNYHFLHLTFQEYFAAKYFVRQWKARERLKCLKLDNGRNAENQPASFLTRYKYTARYDVFWRFVAGLIDSEGKAETLRFFQTIEDIPRDLLGPTHQRLVIHCLSEVASQEKSIFTPLRTKLEEELSRWLLLECKVRGRSRLACERELPKEALGKAFKQSSERAGVILLESLRRQPAIPSSTLGMAASWLRGNVSKLKGLAVLQMLGEQQESLSSGIVQAMAAQLENPDYVVRLAAVDALGSQSKLPLEVLQAVTARLKDPDDSVRAAAVGVLGRQSELPIEVLLTVAARLDDEYAHVRQAAVEALGGQSELRPGVLQAVVAGCKDIDENVRQAAVNTLTGRSELPSEALQAVAARLEDRDRDIRWCAVTVLGGLSELPSKVLQTMTVRLTDPNWHVQRAAFDVLRDRSELPLEVLQSVAALVEDLDGNVRQRAVEVLGRQSELRYEVLQNWAALVENPDQVVRSVAVNALSGQLDLSSELLLAVTARLEDQDWLVGLEAAKTLKSQSELPSDVVRAVADRLQDQHAHVRWGALEVLGDRPELRPEVLQAIAARLKDSDWRVQEDAVGALRGRYELPSEVLRAVAATLGDRDCHVQGKAVEVFRWQSELRSDVLQVLTTRLKDPDWCFQRYAVDSLRGRPELYSEVLLAIVARFDDPDSTVRREALDALRGRYELPSEVLQAVADRLKDQHAHVRWGALEVLRGQPELPPEVLQAMAARVEDPDNDVRFEAVNALSCRPDLALQVLQALTARLKDPDGSVRLAAVDALGGQLKLPLEVLQAVTARLKDPDDSVRAAAVGVLGRQSELPAEVLQAVEAPLKDPNSVVRSVAVHALRGRSKLPSEVLQAVAALLEDQGWGVQWAAVEVLTDQLSLPLEIVHRHIQSLGQILLEMCFEKHVSWYIVNDISYIAVGDREIPLQAPSRVTNGKY